VDSQGTIYVADTQNHRIQVFDSTGQQGRTIGSQGNGLGDFYEPRGLAIDAQDNLYIADTWNARIVKMSPNGDWLRVWGTGAVDMGDGRMATITDGSEEENAQNPLGFFGPRGVAVDDQGHVYIADTGNKRIVVTDDDGTYLYQWGAEGSAAGMFQEPTSITIDKSGMLYVADTWNSRVQVFEIGLDGRVSPLPILTWKVPGWSANTYYDPYIAASGDGRIYVSVPARNQVLAASPIGEISLRWGGSGQDMASLELPSGIAVGPSGDVYVVDRQRERILRFTVPDVLPR
jgi:sugar lactone lactonase YvrE